MILPEDLTNTDNWLCYDVNTKIPRAPWKSSSQAVDPTDLNNHTSFNESLKHARKDDGIGITEEQVTAGCSLGILGMRERIRMLEGKLDICGGEEKGTKVKVVIPAKQEIKPGLAPDYP